MGSNYIIYKAVNTITNEVYIGASTKGIEERKQDHLQKAKNKVGSYFQEAIGTYGPEAFTWEVIDTAYTNDELAQKEVKYVLENNAFEQGYNSDRGGGIKKSVYQYNLDGSLNTTFEDLTTAGNSIDVRKQDISRACWSANHTLGGYLWSYEHKEPFVVEPDNRKKEVVQYNLNGNLLAEYISVAEASRKNGISKSSIAKCCRGERNKAGGFLWKYS